MAIQKILVVDDSATDRFYLTEIFERFGYKVEQLESGDECLAKVESIKPDLVIMDIIMPGTTGFQAARSISRNPATSHIPIILCTGKKQPTDEAWAKKMGALECLAKPVDETFLLDFISKLD